MTQPRIARRLLALVGALALPLLVSPPALAAQDQPIRYDAQVPGNTAKIGELMKSFCNPEGGALRVGSDGALLIAASPWQIDQKILPATGGLCEISVTGSKKLDPAVVRDRWQRLFEYQNNASGDAFVERSVAHMTSRTLGFSIDLGGDRSWFENPIKGALSASFNYQEVSQTTRTQLARQTVPPRKHVTVYQVPDVTEYARGEPTVNASPP
ncbi:putative exonuclease [Streptomyces sp. NBRC 110611]|uniref:hypothetical protein n=1 Tax=Streptomyces sp. NBRC 110611 TaxID=1621259 RepID=UPI000833EBCE|nr:hypothetical protein [Streptomyces sp. NBRC 110611]GAU65892.1 putative exonuclease [Streptomyces sp. NBRC 110611]